MRNCAGGPTPWGSWITCEETVYPKGAAGAERDHGFNFEVPARARPGLAAPVPLLEMGRFMHEAIAVDARTGIVYQTEDRPDGLIYRFIPKVRGQLARGGRLQALVVRDKPSLDTRNWADQIVKAGSSLAVSWLDMDDVLSPRDDLRARGAAAGAAVFARGEGMWFASQGGRSEIYFACTNGGKNKKGQIWRYLPSRSEGTKDEAKNPGKLELWAEPNDGNVCNNADNLTVTPRGDVFFAEDGSAPNGLALISRDGTLSRFALLRSSSELAGVCFSPDGKTMFFNAQKDGQTFAVTGPFRRA
jgi:secreted PhoX family phosphatase